MINKDCCNGGFNIINFDIERYSKDKKVIADTIGYETLNMLDSAFRIKGLPNTIKEKWLKHMLFIGGYTFCTDEDLNGVYAFQGGLGGIPDEYYQPTEIIINNPFLKYNKRLDVNTQGVLISFDTLRQGIIPIIGKYAGLLAENTITIRIADIMSRITNIISAGDESTITSALEYFNQIEDGTLGIIEENPFLADLKIQAGASSGNTRITDLIELEQYLKSSLHNEIGLQANWNMKRESINSNEAQLNDDHIHPYIDTCMRNVKEGVDKLNEMYGDKYGFEASVEFDSAWAENEYTREFEVEKAEIENEILTLESEQIEADIEQIEAETELIIDEVENNDENSRKENDKGNISEIERNNEESEEQEDGGMANESVE